MISFNDDTIAAIATPPGDGGIAILRVSGKNAIKIVAPFFQGKVSLEKAEAWRAYLGKFYFSDLNNGENNLHDQVIVTVFRAPRSYTKEDVVEISCHGGSYLAHRILQSLIVAGSRLADPGEFTTRAFLNGRIDLSQAEAIGTLIRAKSDLAIKSSISQLEGHLSHTIRRFRNDILQAISLLELELDFSEEDVEFVERAEIDKMLKEIVSQIRFLLDTFSRAKIVRDGASVVLAGKPNVGKSSLMNALLKENRAIVTAIPGTTRDTLEEQINIGGVLLRLLDTAGIIQSDDPIEAEGVRRSRERIITADFVLLVIDGSRLLDAEDKKIIQLVMVEKKEDNVVCIINKSDLPPQIEIKDINNLWEGPSIVRLSTLKGNGLTNLMEVVRSKLIDQVPKGENDILITNIRHKISLEQALDSINNARQTLGQGLSEEFVSADLRHATDSLGMIIGEVSSTDILENIFSKFCIGK